MANPVVVHPWRGGHTPQPPSHHPNQSARIMDQVRGGTQPGNQWRAGGWVSLGRWSPGFTDPVPASILAALGLLATFPPVGAWPLGWLALAPVLAAFRRNGRAESGEGGQIPLPPGTPPSPETPWRTK